MCDVDCMFFLFGIVIFGLIGACFFIGDDMDVVNTERLGMIICKEENLSYSHREWHPDHLGPIGVPVIVCEDTPRERLIDGIVVKE